MSGIEIYDDDFMPYMCLKCIKLLISSFVFKRMVIEANEQLLSEKLIADNEVAEHKITSEAETLSEVVETVTVKKEILVEQYDLITNEEPVRTENIKTTDSTNKETNIQLDPKECSKKRLQKPYNPEWQCQVRFFLKSLFKRIKN